MFSEKLRSLLKFGPTSTRYKDLFDMYYLIDYINHDKLQVCLTKLIFSDEGMHENNMEDVIRRIQLTFRSKPYQKRINSSDKRWIDIDNNTLFDTIIKFLSSLAYSTV